MATLTPRLFSRRNQAEIDEEQLLRLFWNRAELKKELAALEKEMDSLREHSQQKEALMLRVQQRLGHLEALLSDPASSAVVVTYYQLRGVWHHCNQLLQTLSTDLQRAARDSAQQKFIASQEALRKVSLVRIEQEYASVSSESDELANRINSLRAERKSNSGILRTMQRRRITTELNLQREKRRNLNSQLQELNEQKLSFASQPEPDFEELNVTSKRKINLVTIAYAQELFLVFQDYDIAKLAREAALAQVNDVSYDGRRNCRTIRQNVAEKLAVLANDKTLKRRIETRSRYLGSVVEYRNEQDSVPMAASLAMLALVDADGRAYNEISTNVLADEYWDLFSVLLG